MQVSKIDISNWWGKEKVTLEFNHRVNFITGPNGSGKSSLCNIIHDTLNFKTKNPSTSKYRFWSSIADMKFLSEEDESSALKMFSNVKVETIVLPDTPSESFKSKVNECFDGEMGSGNITEHFKLLKKIEAVYKEEESTLPKHVSYISDENNPPQEKEYVLRLGNPDISFGSDPEATLYGQPLSFLYQEDRTNLHGKKKSDKVQDVWSSYASSIDDRFLYVRDKVSEWQIDNRDKMLTHFLRKSKSEIDFTKMENEHALSDEQFDVEKKRHEEFLDFVSKLNEYFLPQNKIVSLSKDNETDSARKINLRFNDSGELIPWELLSRGEKTILYLFLSVFYYKEKVSIFIFDEPEIALHVKWQKNLIRDLSDLAPTHQFIIATHSPSLVKNGWLAHCIEVRP